MRYVDLFAGIGGLRLGFEQALRRFGVEPECVLSSEIDSAASETYRLNFGEKPSGDIRSIDRCPDFDFLLAGFPCQPFSFAGKQMGFGDTRGTLFFEIERLLKNHRPKGFLLENVRGLVSHDGGRTLQTILNNLTKLGYQVDWLLLNSSEFNVPQNRVRLYIVGLLENTPLLSLVTDKGAADSHVFKNRHRLSAPKLVRDILQCDAPSAYDCSPGFKERLFAVLKTKNLPVHGVRMIDFRNGQSVHSWELGIKGECTQTEIALMNALVANRRKKKFGAHQDGKSLSIGQIRSFFDHDELLCILRSLVEKKYLKERGGLYNLVAGNMSFEIFKFLDPDSISITIVSSDAHKLGVYHQGRLRRITPRECARLQGFPDSFKVHPTDGHAYRQFGNSVSVPVIDTLLTDLFRHNPIYLGLKPTEYSKRIAQVIETYDAPQMAAV
jgi:DNA (cytosine-5)-methyltransferase 1